jgi:muconolactone delta-isomerase
MAPNEAWLARGPRRRWLLRVACAPINEELLHRIKGDNTMQFLVIGKPQQQPADSGPSQEMKRLSVEEFARTREYYAKGLLRNIWRLEGQRGAVCLFEADSMEHLQELVAEYPLVRLGFVHPEIFTLAPYPGLGPTNP